MIWRNLKLLSCSLIDLLQDFPKPFITSHLNRYNQHQSIELIKFSLLCTQVSLNLERINLVQIPDYCLDTHYVMLSNTSIKVSNHVLNKLHLTGKIEKNM